MSLRHLTTTFQHHINPSSLTQTVIIRSKHSATQVKRLFKNNPARLRLQKKAEGGSNNNIEGSKQVVIPSRTYPAIFKPTFLQNGWSAPPPEDVVVPEYPFRVERTGNKPFGAVGFLPVYRDVRIHGTKHTTIIRNVSGDIPTFLNELLSVLQLPQPKKILNTYDVGGTGSFKSNASRHGGGEAGRGVNNEYPIRIRAGNVIEVNGDRAKEVKRWLAGLGF